MIVRIDCTVHLDRQSNGKIGKNSKENRTASERTYFVVVVDGLF